MVVVGFCHLVCLWPHAILIRVFRSTVFERIASYIKMAPKNEKKKTKQRQTTIFKIDCRIRVIHILCISVLNIQLCFLHAIWNPSQQWKQQQNYWLKSNYFYRNKLNVFWFFLLYSLIARHKCIACRWDRSCHSHANHACIFSTYTHTLFSCSYIVYLYLLVCAKFSNIQIQISCQIEYKLSQSILECKFV